MFRGVRRVGLVLSLSLLLFGCGNAPDSSPAAVGTRNPYADGQQFPWEYHADTILRPQSLTPGINTLQYERLLYARNGWGPVEKNRSNGEQTAGDGKALSLNYTKYAQGYGVHANSELRFSLAGTNGAQCTRFTSYVGLDDEVKYSQVKNWRQQGSVVFQVFLDGVKVYEATDSQFDLLDARLVDLNIANKKELRLVVTDAGDGISYDHADWADPKIYCQTPQTPGSLDFAFGQGGEVLTDFVFGELFSTSDIAVDSQNRVVMSGTTPSSTLPTTYSGILARYNPDGTLDRSFGSGGKVMTDRASDVAIDSQGRIVITGGRSRGDSGLVAYVTRYTATGALDPSFGAGGTVEWLSVSGGLVLDLDSKDRVVVMGNKILHAPCISAYGCIPVARFTANGALDSSFGQGGEVYTEFRRDDGRVYTISDVGSVAVDAQDRVVVGGQADNDGLLDFGLVRYTTDGKPDQSFGRNGQVITDVVLPPDDFANSRDEDRLEALVMDSQNRIVAAGNTGIVRYNADGTLDQSFGSGGRVTSIGAFSLALDAAGRLVTASISHNDLGWFKTSVRLTPDGALDASFGPGQKIRLRMAVNDVAIDSTGRIILAGSVPGGFETSPFFFALARYLP